MDDIDAMFSELLGEMDHLSQSLSPAADPPEADPALHRESTFSIGFTDLNESLNELEDHDLDALVADLGSKSTTQDLTTHQQNSSLTDDQFAPPAMTQRSEAAAALPQTPNTAGVQQRSEPQTKADKIKMALEKLKEAKVRKLIIKVMMSDNSSKTLMVDERQTVREVLDKLFEKTHCDCNINWSLCETNPELQIERGFEDHESLVELLSEWTRHSENKIYFVSRPQKYVMFTDPQIFYMWKKKTDLTGINEHAKQLLLKEHFGGSTLIVPDLEGMLYLKEDGKKVWKSRYFVLRASGIYYVPKGKTKSSSDLACFIRFDKVNIYTTNNYKQKYRAPTNFCFMLKHPCIQKESHYIKFLCCDDEHTLLLWVNSIRIAKYGTGLYKNYQAAVKRVSTLQTLQSAAHKDPRRPHPTTQWTQGPAANDTASDTTGHPMWSCAPSHLQTNPEAMPLGSAHSQVHLHPKSQVLKIIHMSHHLTSSLLLLLATHTFKTHPHLMCLDKCLNLEPAMRCQ
ncbi:amyloid beta A4 precursor protein-binding family B member 1-interacting protein isoform X2 [Lates calcarifer]|nr:amyloid beta A4 precursor protein-binding family B member 1-interacting protein isoform X2 [Lates calcarifer]XP_018532926.1 amyloid beta A4 precursor protein-binding family B member 1-interacting protein isoform X2 [Lates calcarifer]XP_050926096.1 amyloid beta A4 precursor protein-binding family B member 1-interacting protein isoform X2 [Lates calcarifer]